MTPRAVGTRSRLSRVRAYGGVEQGTPVPNVGVPPTDTLAGSLKPFAPSISVATAAAVAADWRTLKVFVTLLSLRRSRIHVPSPAWPATFEIELPDMSAQTVPAFPPAGR